MQYGDGGGGGGDVVLGGLVRALVSVVVQRDVERSGSV